MSDVKVSKTAKVKTYASFSAIVRAKDDKHLPRGSKTRIKDGRVQVFAPDGTELFGSPIEEFAIERLKHAGFKAA
jgi:hypothetical protein